MKWRDVIPEHIAERQEAWERRHAMRRAVESGATRREIAAHEDITTARVCQLVMKAGRDDDKIAPVERYLATQLDRDDIRAWRRHQRVINENLRITEGVGRKHRSRLQQAVPLSEPGRKTRALE